DYRGIVDGVSKRLRQEVVLAHEQAHLEEAARLYAKAPDILVPELFPFCTDDVTAMTRIDGVKLTDVPLAQRAHAARLLSDALIARPFLSRNVRVPFHADPHPGNLMLTDNGELGILDWSLVVRLDENERRAFKILLRSALGLDETGLVRGLQGICTQPPSIGELRRVASESVRQLRRGTAPGLRWITETIDRAVMEARVQVSDDLVLLRKALHTLNGVASELSSVSAIDTALVTRAIRRYAADTANAMVNPAAAPLSVAAGINAALFGLWVDAPATASRYWLGVWQDLLADQRA
ncbi:MAG TPA: AarF/UbiB family protein, partial [Gammaproteobacteria bacterium]